MRVLMMALGAALAAPAMAGPGDALKEVEPLLAPQALLSGVVTEQDVTLLFAHLRASMLAAAEGREAPPLPEDLNRRIEAAGEEMRARGTILGLALSFAMERAARDAVREFARPPASRD
jgi:hypothetical protein